MTAKTRLFLYALRVTLALGCSTPAEESAAPSGPCPLGDASSTAKTEMTIVARTPDGRLAPLAEGDALSLIEPPQGGQVVFVGVRAKNLDGCGVLVTASLRDATSGRLIGIESRPIDLVKAADGFGETPSPGDITTFANVPVCPNRDAVRALSGLPYQLDVSLRDREGRTAQASISVVPTCSEQVLCPCECGAAACR